MSEIPIEKVGWEYNEAACPPDRDFIEYLEQNKRDIPITVFHMGPGIHHRVGLWAVTQKNVFVRAISITPPEVDEYMRLATLNPELNSKYLVDFGDLHLIPEQLLPRMDYITLFHLGEISAQVDNPDYHGASISQVVSELARRLSIRGEMMFYEGSVAWEKVKSAVEVNMVYKYQFERSAYKSLTIFKKTRV
jgi:hypothetical protein